MITVPLINWQPMANMPEDRKDGRLLLLAVPNILGTIDGGDGVMTNPKWPWFYYIASWAGGKWETTESDEIGNWERLELSVPTYWADINPPA